MKRTSTIVAIAYIVACGAVVSAAPWDHAYGQVPVLTLPAPLAANSGNQNIKLSKARPPLTTRLAKLCPATAATPAYSYVDTVNACPVPPTVPEPTPAPEPAPIADVALASGEAFLRNDALFVGIGASGALGSMNAAPAGYGHAGAPYARKALYLRGTASELLGVGAYGDTWTVAYTINGMRRLSVAGPLSGRTDIAGTFAADGTWTGRKDCIAVQQAPTLLDARLVLSVTLTNVCGQPISDVRYLRSQDVDDGHELALVTSNRIAATDAVEAGLLNRSKGRTYRLSGASARAAIATQGVVWSPDNAALLNQPVGYAVKAADRNLTLVWRLGDLAAGASSSLSVEMAVR